MKNKKLLSIGASSLMLLNAGLAPATALAEENKTEKTEATGEQSSELKNNLAEDPLAKITNGGTQSATQQSNNYPASEGTAESATTAQTEESSTVVSSEAEATVGQTKESSSTDANSGTQTEESSTKVTSDDVKKPEDGSIQTKGIDILAHGNAKAKSSTGKELVIHEKKTEGVVSVDLHVEKTLTASISDSTYYQVKLPDEFNPLLQNQHFIDYVSSKAYIRNNISTFVNGEIVRSDIQVDPNSNSIVVKIPKFSDVSLRLFADLHLGMDLGKFVTDTGIRIPNSLDGKYHFSTAWTQHKDILNWTAIGSNADQCDLEYDQLDPAYGTEKPVITASDRRITLGQEFTGDFALKGVRAFDKEDGDITKDVVMLSDHPVNSNVPGVYQVTYKVTDSHGLFATKTINVTVGENKKPVIKAEDKTIYKGDAFNPLADVTAYDEEDGDLTSKIDIKSNNVDVNVPGTYYITYAVTDSEGLVGTQDITVTVKDTAGEVTPNDYRIGQSLITGTYSGEVSSLGLYVDDNLVSKDGLLDNGKFTIEVNKDLIKKDSKVVVVAYNKDHKELDRKTVNVVGEKHQGTITAYDYTVGEDSIHGTYTGDVKKAKVIVNGKVLSLGGTFSNGEFSYWVGKDRIKKGDSVYINGYDADGAVLSQNNKVNVIGNPETHGTITPNAYTLGDSEITGTYTGDVKKARVIINGKVLPVGGTFSNGHFTYWVGANRIKNGDTVMINGYDQNDKLLTQNNPVHINPSPQKNGTLTANAYTVGDQQITGTYTGDIKKARVIVNGKTLPVGGTFSNGQFTYWVGANRIKNGDTVTMNGYDKNDKLLTQNNPVKINPAPQQQGTITPDDYTLGDAEITGTYTGNVKTARITINGVPYKFGGTFKNGRFTYYVGDKIKEGDRVSITAYGENNVVLQENVPVDFTKAYIGTITLDKYKLGTTVLTGTYTGDVKSAELVVNGTPVVPGGTFKDGKFNFYVGNKIKKGDTDKLIAFAPNGEKLDEKTIEIN
ncbi:TPA: immunoglobulin-like domain-containing protein [Enterococcus faecium]|nr:DUF5011 domain-containing protein [Enterococcus faecium]EKZ0431006.1 DUF5011 domain-containing protein [Enterococcus faecium]